jgi:hypothetical protein
MWRRRKMPSASEVVFCVCQMEIVFKRHIKVDKDQEVYTLEISESS